MNKEKLVNAVNDLCEIDSNFDEHLSKLANIAKTKPDIYKIAIKHHSQTHPTPVSYTHLTLPTKA